MAPYNDDREITYEIVEEIGVLTEQSTGWKKELNVVAWNGGQAKYDIREWSPNHTQMGRGLTLNEREMRTIIDLLKRRARYVPRKSYSSREESAEPARVADDSATAYQTEKAQDYEPTEEQEIASGLESASGLETADDFEESEEFAEPTGYDAEEAQAATA